MSDDANPRSKIASRLDEIGERIQDAAEDTFWLFSQRRGDHDLGMLDATAVELNVSVSGRDFTIRQAPGLLTSSRTGGTTGAALWKVTHLLASWLSSAQNAFFKTGLIDAQASVLELGAGIAGLIPLALAPLVKSCLATDQSYATKLLNENVQGNLKVPKDRRKDSQRQSSNITVAALDWETDDLPHFLASHGFVDGVDVIIASDCIFNYHLIEPLVETCAGACKLRFEADRWTICLIAQQLRQPDVFEQWLESFLRRFDVWRLSDETVGPSLDSQSGYVLHVGILKDPSAS